MAKSAKTNSAPQTKLPKSAEFLKQRFLALKKHDGLSLRQWSQLNGFSPSFLNLVLNGKRVPAPDSLVKIVQGLELDELQMSQLQILHEADWRMSKGFTGTSSQSAAKVSAMVDEVKTVEWNEEVLLKSWLHFALLEFVTCENFQESPASIAKHFGVSEREAAEALKDLEQSEMLQRNSKGNLSKATLRQRIPTKRSRLAVRQMHLQMLRKAIDVLEDKSAGETFANRLITGYTVAVAPEQIETAKVLIQEALINIATALSEGNSQSVYQLQVQLFPLSKLP